MLHRESDLPTRTRLQCIETLALLYAAADHGSGAVDSRDGNSVDTLLAPPPWTSGRESHEYEYGMNFQSHVECDFAYSCHSFSCS